MYFDAANYVGMAFIDNYHSSFTDLFVVCVIVWVRQV